MPRRPWEPSVPRGRVVKAGSSNSYHREVRGSIPGGRGFFLARGLPFFTSTSTIQAAEKSSKQAEDAAEAMGAEKFSLKMVPPSSMSLKLKVPGCL